MIGSSPSVSSWMLGTGLILAAVAAGLSPVLLRHLPEPQFAGPGPGYRRLANRNFALAVWALSSLAALPTALRVRPDAAPLWLSLSSLGVLLVSVDAITTWLPLPLTKLLWLSTSLAYAGSVLWAGLDPWRTLAGAAATAGFFWLAWRLSGGGIGFGDVRLAPVLGATAAAQSWSVLLVGLVLGSLAGAAYGIIHRLRGNDGEFPYGPALMLGPYLALLCVS